MAHDARDGGDEILFDHVHGVEFKLQVAGKGAGGLDLAPAADDIGVKEFDRAVAAAGQRHDQRGIDPAGTEGADAGVGKGVKADRVGHQRLELIHDLGFRTAQKAVVFAVVDEIGQREEGADVGGLTGGGGHHLTRSKLVDAVKEGHAAGRAAEIHQIGGDGPGMGAHLHPGAEGGGFGGEDQPVGGCMVM